VGERFGVVLCGKIRFGSIGVGFEAVDWEQKGLTALSSERGVLAAPAIDQRSALRKLFAAASGYAADDSSGERLANFKTEVSKQLTPYASAILLDPEYGLMAAAHRDSHAGLLLAYEKTGYDKSILGKLPSTLGAHPWHERIRIVEGRPA
jgi:tagatose 1,6-diphosphate aldolase